jgi:hypothetical protein
MVPIYGGGALSIKMRRKKYTQICLTDPLIIFHITAVEIKNLSWMDLIAYINTKKPFYASDH